MEEKKHLILLSICRQLITNLAILTVTLFVAITPASAQTETVLHSFSAPLGPEGFTGPQGEVIFDANGNLYGTTEGGGTGTGPTCDGTVQGGCGTVFELKPKAGGGWTKTVLHNFGNGHDGSLPLAGLILDGVGNLYGTTLSGGTGLCDCGTVFELMPQAGGGWKEKVLYSFKDHHNAAYPFSSLLFDAAGDLFGTTTGGAFNYGTAYELKPQSDGTWTESLLHSFSQKNDDATSPVGGLVADASGNLYGTSSTGGSAANAGTIFEFTPEPDGRWAYKILFAFAGFPDGSSPFTGVIFDAAGNLYGTTYQGGTFNEGTVFELSPTPSGGWTEKLLHSFGGSDGVNPLYARLTMDAAGNLYGTTYLGGSNNFGVAFELTLGAGGTWAETILHNFGSGANDAQKPYAGLNLGASGNLYGTTLQGGAAGGGTVFKIVP